jgi:serine protease Do
MKLLFAPFAFILFGSQVSSAQERDFRNNNQEIIIRKKEGKDIKITLEFDRERVIVNGKPLMEFNEDGITIMRRRMRLHDGPPPPPPHFRRELSPENMDDVQMDRTEQVLIDSTAFLGVVTVTAPNNKGAEIESVSKGSAAEIAGLQVGDIILSINKNKITTPADLSKEISEKKPNEKVEISFLRNGKEKKCDAVLQLKKRMEKKIIIMSERMNDDMTASPFQRRRAPGMPPPLSLNENFIIESAPFDGDFGNIPEGMDIRVQINNKPKIGLKIQDTQSDDGVKVIEVAEGSAAADAGIKIDDIITQIGLVEISNTDEAREQLKTASLSNKTAIKLTRSGKTITLQLSMPKKLKTADL